MLSVLIKGNETETTAIAGKLVYFTLATSLGGVESLVEHRKSVEGLDSPTPFNLLRISVGIEHIDDLIADWKKALSSEN
jgi:cystathionine gamma-synthase